MAKKQKTDDTDIVRIWSSWSSYVAGRNVKWYNHFEKSLAGSFKLPILSPRILVIYLRKMKTYVHTKTWTKMFVAALITIAKNWKYSQCMSAEKWLARYCRAIEQTTTQ